MWQLPVSSVSRPVAASLVSLQQIALVIVPCGFPASSAVVCVGPPLFAGAPSTRPVFQIAAVCELRALSLLRLQAAVIVFPPLGDAPFAAIVLLLTLGDPETT
jgi:hypothetical protein